MRTFARFWFSGAAFDGQSSPLVLRVTTALSLRGYDYTLEEQAPGFSLKKKKWVTFVAEVKNQDEVIPEPLKEVEELLAALHFGVVVLLYEILVEEP